MIVAVRVRGWMCVRGFCGDADDGGCAMTPLPASDGAPPSVPSEKTSSCRGKISPTSAPGSKTATSSASVSTLPIAALLPDGASAGAPAGGGHSLAFRSLDLRKSAID